MSCLQANILRQTGRIAVLSLLSVVASFAMSQVANAQGRPLLIVPFEREQVDDAFFDRYMDRIRSDASLSTQYKPMDKIDQTLNDLLFAVGCAEPAPECLQLIGETFNAEVILYGSLWRNERTTLHTVQMFDLLTGASLLEIPIESTFETDDDEALFSRLIGEIQQIFFPYSGAITVDTSEPGAEIFFDGAPVGDTTNGPITLSERPLGEHSITARIADREVSETVVLLYNEPGNIVVDMTKPAVAGPGGISHLGSYIAFGVGGLSLIGGGVFSVLTNSANTEAEDLTGKSTLSADDVDAANSVLSNGPTYQTVQFALYGVGAAAVITGAILYFFVEGTEGGESAPDADAEPEGSAFFAPTISEDGVGASAIFTF